MVIGYEVILAILALPALLVIYHHISNGHSWNNNFSVTERKGRTGECWPEVVAVGTERSEVRSKTTEANIPQYMALDS